VFRLCTALAFVTLSVALASPALAQDATIAHGMKVFEAQKCSLCHSIGDKGNKKGPLDHVGSKLTADEIRMWMVSPAEMTKKTKAERKPPMKAYTSLSKTDLDALVLYMQSLKDPKKK
jgi:mono/diheme cytochrome c family protein